MRVDRLKAQIRVLERLIAAGYDAATLRAQLDAKRAALRNHYRDLRETA